MTPEKAIQLADEMKPNMMSAEVKYQFLNEIEGKVFHEVIMTHEHDEDAECPHYEPPTPGETEEAEEENESEEETEEETEEESEEEEAEDEPAEMLAPSPYDMLYVYWLMCQIDHVNQEMDKYNNDRGLFENAWGNFADYWNRTKMPIQRNRQLWT